MGAPYLTKSRLLAIAQQIDPNLVDADIIDEFFATAGEIIENRTRVWDLETSVILNGEGTNQIILPVAPIISLDSITIIASDLTETELIISGADRQIEYDPNISLIKAKKIDLNRIEIESYCWNIFPIGLQNIVVEGSFGKGPNNILATLQTLLTFRFLRTTNGKFNQIDLISETLGEYKWMSADMQYSKDPKNSKMTLDGMIEFLFSSLPFAGFCGVVDI